MAAERAEVATEFRGWLDDVRSHLASVDQRLRDETATLRD